ncbi:plasmid mobilization protein [Lysinibacillus xylanilyticus]|uniref:plasmid mobilization protein n=1 Tax=Lysinibacillus xylanilyticus TaxID=582475 RepID=UPI003D03EC7C
MFVNKTYLQLSVSEDEKKYLKEKAKELGYKSVSAFLVDSAKSHFKIEIDMKAYRELATEINYIGKNVNSLIRRINTDGFYSDNDIEFLRTNQKKIITLMNKEYDRLLNLKEKYTSDNLNIKEKENLIKALQQNEINVPLKTVLEEVFEQIKDDLLYIGEAIENSPKQEKEVADYVWEYLYGDTLFELDKNKLIEFANKIFIFTQKLKMKLLKLDNVFDDDDWFALKDILDEYEICLIKD